jgi:hypothetical protein
MSTLLPPPSPYWLPPLKMRLLPWLELNRSFAAALAELEEKYPQRRVFTLEDRQHQLLKRRPR